VKKCSYCGRENSDEAVHCRECGTELVVPSAGAAPVRPRGGTWLAWLVYMLRFAGTILLIGCFYLLSFGPVERYCCTRTVLTSPAPTMLSVSSQAPAITIVRSVTERYPAWVSAVYRPVFLMLSGSGGNGLYGRYLQWWVKPPGDDTL
jgi:hypothetical protein